MTEIRVEGIRELRAAIRQADGDPKALKDGSFAAADLIARRARGRLAARGGKLGRKLARKKTAAPRPSATQTAARVRFGGAGIKSDRSSQAAAAMEWGALRGRYNFYGRHPWVGNQHTTSNARGHYIGWAAERYGAEAADAWGEALQRRIEEIF